MRRISELRITMSFRDKFITTGCYIRSACKREADQQALKSLFERDWEVFVIKHDPATGQYRSQTLCCDSAPVHPMYATKLTAASCR